MSVVEAIVAYLETDPGISNLVGKRIYPLVAPEHEKPPLIVYQRISTVGSHTKLGPTGQADTRLQFSCWAKRLTDAYAIAGAIRARLDGLKGDLSGVHISKVESDTEGDLYEPLVGLYQVVSDYIISH